MIGDAMDKLRAMALFVRLAELRSFTRVADEYGASRSMISKEIQRLEDSLGARLLQRSTRRLQLTEMGQGYLRRCREILLKLDDAESYVQELQGRPRGKLRINAPMALGNGELARLFVAFMQVYPDIELDIHLSDEPVDLIEQGFDLGFRAASAPFDSAYVGRPLTHFHYRICAAPSYLAAHSAITNAEDLRDHNCFVYNYFRGKNLWPVGDGVAVRGSLKANSTPFLMEAIREGVGIGFIPDFVCAPALEAGEVVEVLADVPRPQLTLYALYPAREFVPPKLQCCVEFAVRWFQRQQQSTVAAND